MTVDELLKEFQKLSDEGKGDYNVIDGDYCEDIYIGFINDDAKVIFAT